MPYLILTLSIALQFVAAFLALRITTVTNRVKIWAPIAIAITLMALRRCLTLYEWLTGTLVRPIDVATELTALTTSALMIAGVILITPILRSTQHSLERLRIRHESILNSAGEGIFGLDREGKTIFVNPAAATMTGYRENELIGQNLHNIIHHTKSNGTPCPLEDCMNYLALHDGEIHRVIEDLFWNKKGESFPVRYVTTPLKDNDQIIGCVVVFRDITDRKQGEEKLRESEKNLHYLTSQLLTAQERERERIFRDLHDDLGQSLWPAPQKLIHMLS